MNIATLQDRIRNSMSRLLILRLMLLVLLSDELLLIQSLPAESLCNQGLMAASISCLYALLE